jgi:hypothetical protein
MASIRFWVCIFSIPLYLANPPLNHLFIPPNVRSTLNLVLPISLLNFFPHRVKGLFLYTFFRIWFFSFRCFNNSTFFFDCYPLSAFKGMSFGNDRFTVSSTSSKLAISFLLAVVVKTLKTSPSLSVT